MIGVDVEIDLFRLHKIGLPAHCVCGEAFQGRLIIRSLHVGVCAVIEGDAIDDEGEFVLGNGFTLVLNQPIHHEAAKKDGAHDEVCSCSHYFDLSLVFIGGLLHCQSTFASKRR